MARIPGLPRRFRFPWRTAKQIRDEVDEELEFHLDARAGELVRQGMSPEAAREQARREFGDLEGARRYCREMDEHSERETRRTEWFDGVRRDVRYAARQLARSRGFTLAATLTLALGIGVNTLVYSIVDGALFGPVPWPEPDRLVSVYGATPSAGQNRVSYPNFHDWRAEAHSFESMAAYGWESFNLSGGEQPEHVSGAAVSATLFPLLGIEPTLGRGFLPEEDREGAEPVVVLGHTLWENRFGADREVIGRTARLDGVPHTIVGVMPPGFGFPYHQQLWTPLALDPTANRDSRRLSVMGRLKPGVTRERADAELDAISRRLEEQYPETNAAWRATVTPLREAQPPPPDVAIPLYLMMGAVGFVLLIACANLANLLLARGAARQRELAVRAALGAGRWRIVRQLLTESLLLALLGGVGGVLLAFWGLELIRASMPSDEWIPAGIRLVIDARVLAFTILLTIGTGLLCGLAPALRITRPDIRRTLGSGGRGAGDTPERGRLRSMLVVGQIALSLVLLIGATLLVRSFLQLQAIDPGFDRHGVITMRMTLTGPAYEQDSQRIAFWDQLLERVDALPGIEEAATVNLVPLTIGSSGRFSVEGQDVPEGQEPLALMYATAGEYLRAMRIPLLSGRGFSPAETADSAAHVVLVNESLAERSWPGENPLGKRLRLSRDADAPWYTVVGVAADVRHWQLASEPGQQIYFPYGTRSFRGMTLVARTTGDPTATVPAIRRAIASLDPNLPVYAVQTMDGVIRQSLWMERFTGSLFGSFGLVALLLAVVGVYGVMAYMITQRTHEIGVRVALGAQRREVLRLILRRGLWLTLIGVGIGVALSLAVTRLLAGILYGVRPTDLMTFVGIPLLLAGVALLASYIPARRATRVDPMIALRAE